MDTLIDLFLHLDVHLATFVASYGVWVYGVLFAVIFAETGLVVRSEEHTSELQSL